MWTWAWFILFVVSGVVQLFISLEIKDQVELDLPLEERFSIKFRRRQYPWI